MSDLTPFSNVTATHGGKAAGLARLVRHGFRVPQGVALDTSAVLKLLDGNRKARSDLKNWLSSVSGSLAIRSSALNEDSGDRSFAGMYETLLKIEPSLDTVIDGIRKVAASGMSERVNSYSDENTPTIPVIIQNLVEAEVSGVLFTGAIDPIGRDCSYIEWVPGFGDALVSGKVTPSSISLPWKPSALDPDLEAIQISGTVPQPTVVNALVQLIESVAKLESRTDWDIEWAIDAEMRLWVLQLRPQTQRVLVPHPTTKANPLPAAPGIGAGPVHLVDDDNQGELRPGDVLVAQITEVNYVPAMTRASAIVTEEGGLLSHAAIVARELGKPCVVGVTGARAILKSGRIAEVDGTAGIIRQDDIVLGGVARSEIDWTYLYLYDRGWELSVAGVQTYIEPTPDGLVVYLDDALPPQQTALIEAEIRRRYHRTPKIVTRDKRIWYREWRRFNRLQSIAIVDACFRSAISAWNQHSLTSTIDRFKRVVESLSQQTARNNVERLFWSELGAALHALVAVEVEGFALWNCYRETATWRSERHLNFVEFVRGTSPEVDDDVGISVASIRSCLTDLANLRNDAYNYFSTIGVFDGEYFGSRADLVQSACFENGIKYKDEDSSLELLYQTDTFGRLDHQFLQTIFEIMHNGL